MAMFRNLEVQCCSGRTRAVGGRIFLGSDSGWTAVLGRPWRLSPVLVSGTGGEQIDGPGVG